MGRSLRTRLDACKCSLRRVGLIAWARAIMPADSVWKVAELVTRRPR